MEKVTQVFEKYWNKDYWMEQETADRMVEEFKAGRRWDHIPATTAEEFKDKYLTYKKKQIMQWLERCYTKMVAGDAEFLYNVVRYDQKVMLDLFKLVSGKAVGRTNSEIKKSIENYLQGLTN